MRMLILGLVVVAGALAAYTFIPPAAYCSAQGRLRIGMAGRSTMEHWFKSWNWPYLVHRYAIWKRWPIPFQRFARGNFYFERIPVPAPAFSGTEEENGRGMYEAIERQADPKRYDALFFKFCFVDFEEEAMDEAARARRLDRMTDLVQRVHALAAGRGMKLVVGTALPVQKPGAQSTKLRIDFGNRVKAYALRHRDVAIVDLFSELTDPEGRLRPEYARAADDDHVNWAGFRRLDHELVRSLSALFPEARRQS